MTSSIALSWPARKIVEPNQSPDCAPGAPEIETRATNSNCEKADNDRPGTIDSRSPSGTTLGSSESRRLATAIGGDG